MKFELGHIIAIFRYPIKSMAGERLDSARIGWHGIEGDRRFALRRLADRGAMPWLTASRLPELLLYQPVGRQDGTGQLPTHIRTPDGREYGITDEALVKEIATRHRGDVELMHLSHGIFDEAAVSAMTLGTIQSIGLREGGHEADIRRFRPNLVIDTEGAQPFEEDSWVGKILEFGSEATGPAISVTMRDKRCVMINLDPDTAEANPAVMQTVIRMNENHAGVYGTVVRTGELRVGQVLSLRA